MLLAGVAVAAALPFMALALLLPSVFDLHVPLAYEGDGLSHGVLVKSVLEVGWFPVHNPRMGAPFGAAWFDYPNADAANLLLLKAIGIVANDWITVANLFYLATFALTSAVSFLVLQRLGARWIYALLGALLFAELPYHFLRAGHLLLSAYWSVPIGVYLAILCGPQGRAVRGSGAAEPGRWSSAAIAVAVACGGIYYAFFTVILVVAGGIANGMAERRWRATLPALSVAALIIATVAIQLGPTFGYWFANGTNKEVARRSAAEAEHYAFKPIQLVLPHSEHRLAVARRIADGYARSTPIVNENATASLGVVAAVGLVLVLGYGLRRMVAERPFVPPLESLSWLAVVALAFGTVGGAGSLLAHAGFTSIRAYNRISVFLGFIGLAGACLLLQRALPRIRETRMRTRVGIAAVIAMAVLGTLDQLPLAMHGASPELASDRRFFAALEHAVAPGTAVYQLPYHPYPEAGPVNAMDDYSLARGYLHTVTLRWSYGATKGRPEGAWLRALADHDLGEQLDVAAASGFGVVYVDRRGYADHGTEVEAVLRQRLGAPIATSENGHLVAYRIPPTGTSPVPLEQLLPKWETPIRFDRETLSPRIAGTAGFSIAEATGRWTNAGTARIEFVTPLPSRFRLRIETVRAMPRNVNVDLPIRVGDVSRTVRVGAGPTVVETEFALTNDGANAIEIKIPEPSSPRELGIGSDTRMLGIHLRSITIIPNDQIGKS